MAQDSSSRAEKGGRKPSLSGSGCRMQDAGHRTERSGRKEHQEQALDLGFTGSHASLLISRKI